MRFTDNVFVTTSGTNIGLYDDSTKVETNSITNPGYSKVPRALTYPVPSRPYAKNASITAVDFFGGTVFINTTDSAADVDATGYLDLDGVALGTVPVPANDSVVALKDYGPGMLLTLAG